VQFLLSFLSLSRSFSFPLSRRTVEEEPVVDLAYGTCGDLGGDLDREPDDAYEPEVALEVTLGKESLYHPPLNVNAIN
jgi:hypothetical protein